MKFTLYILLCGGGSVSYIICTMYVIGAMGGGKKNAQDTRRRPPVGGAFDPDVRVFFVSHIIINNFGNFEGEK